MFATKFCALSQNFMSIAYLVLKLLPNGFWGEYHPLSPKVCEWLMYYCIVEITC